MRMDARLIPHCDVSLTSGFLHATTAAPWLEVVIFQRVPAGCWIEMAYRGSYLDHLVRPLIRFETADGAEWDTLRAPVFGRAVWIGRIPDRTTRILISPVDRAGPFGFEIESISTLPRLGLLARAFRNDLKTAAMAIGARLINARQESRQALQFARGGVPMGEYAHWRSDCCRPYDPEGLDAPRRAPDQIPHVRFIVDTQGAVLTPDTALVSSLSAGGGNWSVAAPVAACGEGLAPDGLDGRMVPLSGVTDLTEGLSAGDLVVRLDPLVSLPDYALAVLAEAAVRESSAICFYGDEEVQGADGAPSDPRFKPDWSPHLEAGLPYLGRPVFWRVEKVRRMQAEFSVDFDTAQWRRLALMDATGTEVHHIRRVLAACPMEVASPLRMLGDLGPVKVETHSVSVIIPTRNQLPMLKTLLQGLRRETLYPIREILIVDNGSMPVVQAFYKTLEDDSRIEIIRMPGPFNFSAMCNAASRRARGDCLVFLNNDIAVVASDWLGPLIAHAMRPGVGAVGARLLFPDGSIQHAGVAVGMGGYADHVNHGAPADDRGYLKRIGVVHEISAVTGACIAVAAQKFHAVGGFDAVNLPVELNDIDLCLRLAAAGWATLMCPQSVLMHHQSASRGFSLRPFQRYGRERLYFRKMWPHVIRDDPFFHPALSLFSTKVALDG